MIKHEKQEPSWLPDAITQLTAQREAAKRESQQAVKQHGLITPEKVIAHFIAAERFGIWSR